MLRFSLLPVRLTLLLGALVPVCTLRASLPAIPPADQRYRAEHWENENGLPQNYAIATTQAKDGYLWIALLEQVVRFNGRQFLTYTTKDSTDSFRCLLVTRDGTLWAGSSSGGLLRFGPKGPEAWEHNGQLASKDVRSLCETEDGSLWIGTANQLVRWHQGKTTVIFPSPADPKLRGAYTLLPEKGSSVLVGTSRGLIRVKQGKNEQVSLPALIGKAPIISLAKDASGTLWVGSAGAGLARIPQNGEAQVLDTSTGLPSNHVRCLLNDRNGVLWAGTMQGLVRWQGDRFVAPEVPDMAIDYDIFSLFQDAEGSLWVSGARGLARLNPGRFALLDKAVGLGRRSLRTVKEFSDGSIWVGASNGGVTRIKNGVSETYRLKEGIERTVDTVLALEEYEPGKAIVATFEGLFLVENGKASQPPKELNYSREIRSLTKDRKGRLWIGTARDGILLYDGRSLRRFSQGPENIPANDVRGITPRTDDSVWVATAEGLLALSDQGSEHWGIKDGLPSNIIQCLHADSAGVLWLGTDKGLTRFAKGKFSTWTEKDGLLSNDIRDLVEDQQGNLWLTSPSGLFRMRKRDLESSASGHKNLLGYMRYGSAWGVVNCTSPSPSSSTATLLRDGRLLFTTVAGLLVVDPKGVEPNLRKPPVVIDSVRYGKNQVSLEGQSVTVGPEEGQLEIDFSALSYQDPSRVLFRYRLDGVDEDWIQTGRQASVSYHNLRNGTFIFHAIACNNDGLWNEEGCQLSITVRPHFQETLLCKVLIFLGLVGSVFLLFWLRYRRIQKSQVELTLAVEERTRSLKEEIASRIQVEAELRGSEERFSRVFGASPIPLALVSLKEECFINANPSFCALLSLPAEAIVGQRDHAIPLWQNPELREDVLREITAHRRVLNRECDILIQGKPRKILLSAEHLGLSSGDLMLLIALDITERIELEQQVRQLQKIEATGQLAAGIAHDFNNLLTVIIGQLSLLLETGSVTSAEDRESLEQAQKAAERAATLTRQLLMFSRKQRLEQKPFAINTLIGRLVQMLRPVMGESVELHCDLAPDLPLLCGDETMIEQVLVNVAMNAKDAMPEGGRFRIHSSLVVLDERHLRAGSEAKPGTFIRISARDNGKGMPRETRERIFEPFFTTKEPGRGTGLGMPMAYGTVKQHGGWIEVHSEVDLGTEVVIYLPPSEAVCTEVKNVASPQTRNTAGGCILYVEDEPAVRKMVLRSLERRGYRVLIATDGREALALWRDKADQIDLVFSDIVMPGGMSGVELAQTLRRDRPNLRVLLATGYSSDAIKLKHDAKLPILAKPFTIEHLLDTIAKELNQP